MASSACVSTGLRLTSSFRSWLRRQPVCSHPGTRVTDCAGFLTPPMQASSSANFLCFTVRLPPFSGQRSACFSVGARVVCSATLTSWFLNFPWVTNRSAPVANGSFEVCSAQASAQCRTSWSELGPVSCLWAVWSFGSSWRRKGVRTHGQFVKTARAPQVLRFVELSSAT